MEGPSINNSRPSQGQERKGRTELPVLKEFKLRWIPPISRQRAIPLAFMSALAIATPAKEVATSPQSPEKEAIVERVLGQDLAQEYRDLGFQISVDVTNPLNEKGNYMIFIGQVHTLAKPGFERAVSGDEVITYQESLKQTLSATAEVANSPVFLEGLGTELDLEKEKRAAKELVAKLEHIVNQDPPALAVDVQAEMGIFTELYDHRNHPLIKNYVPPQLYKDFIKRVDGFINSYSTNPSWNQKMKDTEKFALEIVKGKRTLFSISSYIDIGTQSVAFDDAAITLYMNDKVALHPAEKRETNKKGQEAEEKYKSAKHTYESKLIDMLFSHPEVVNLVKTKIQPLREKQQSQKLSEHEQMLLNLYNAELESIQARIEQELANSPEKKQLDELETNAEKWTMTKREEVLIEFMHNYCSEKKDVCRPVAVFGNDHDISPELQAFNVNLSDPYGLISIRPIEHTDAKTDK